MPKPLKSKKLKTEIDGNEDEIVENYRKEDEIVEINDDRWESMTIKQFVEAKLNFTNEKVSN